MAKEKNGARNAVTLTINIRVNQVVKHITRAPLKKTTKTKLTHPTLNATQIKYAVGDVYSGKQKTRNAKSVQVVMKNQLKSIPRILKLVLSVIWVESRRRCPKRKRNSTQVALIGGLQWTIKVGKGKNGEKGAAVLVVSAIRAKRLST